MRLLTEFSRADSLELCSLNFLASFIYFKGELSTVAFSTATKVTQNDIKTRIKLF